jgi:phosphopentomutase
MAYGDEGANTLGHVFAAKPDLFLPAFFSLGLWKIVTGDVFDPRSQHTIASYGKLRERSAGKDTTTGHWELAGVILEEPFAVMRQFPDELVEAIEREAGVAFLGNIAESGTAIIQRFGEEHLRTGAPILYTSADSVLQIAAHEKIMPRARLHEICRIARRHANKWKIGRVIARPFQGKPANFVRSEGRHDYSFAPPPTILNALSETGLLVQSIGKVADIFAGSGITASTLTESNADGMEKISAVWSEFDNGLVFANLVDFDSRHGHRRDLDGFARALEECDAWLAGFLSQIDDDDLLIITADHGNDPTHKGTDHTREEVPLMMVHGEAIRPLGTRATFADVAATLAEFFSLRKKWPAGSSFLHLPGRDARSVADRA